jgi:hypothetical protein
MYSSDWQAIKFCHTGCEWWGGGGWCNRTLWLWHCDRKIGPVLRWLLKLWPTRLQLAARGLYNRAVATSHAPNRLPASTEALRASLSLPHNLVVLSDGSCISQLRYKDIHERAERRTQMEYTFPNTFFVILYFAFILVVPLHATEAPKEKRAIAPTHIDGREWSASRLVRALVPGEEPSVPTMQEAVWAPEPVWTQRLEEKSFRLCRGSNINRPVVQPVARHCTEDDGSDSRNANEPVAGSGSLRLAEVWSQAVGFLFVYLARIWL